MSTHFVRFSEAARRALSLAQEEAQYLNHSYIGTEHILLALTRLPESIGAKAIVAAGADLVNMRSALEFVIGPGRSSVLGDVGLTPRSKRVIDLSLKEASDLGHRYVGTAHLAVGLLAEGDGVAAGMLQSQGVILEKLRAEALRLLATLGTAPEADAPGEVTAMPSAGMEAARGRRRSPQSRRERDRHWLPPARTPIGLPPLLIAGVVGGVTGGSLVLVVLVVVRLLS